MSFEPHISLMLAQVEHQFLQSYHSFVLLQPYCSVLPLLCPNLPATPFISLLCKPKFLSSMADELLSLAPSQILVVSAMLFSPQSNLSCFSQFNSHHYRAGSYDLSGQVRFSWFRYITTLHIRVFLIPLATTLIKQLLWSFFSFMNAFLRLQIHESRNYMFLIATSPWPLHRQVEQRLLY